MMSATPGNVGLNAIRKQLTKPVSSVPPWLFPQFLPLGFFALSSLNDRLQIVTENEPFLPKFLLVTVFNNSNRDPN